MVIVIVNNVLIINIYNIDSHSFVSFLTNGTPMEGKERFNANLIQSKYFTDIILSPFIIFSLFFFFFYC